LRVGRPLVVVLVTLTWALLSNQNAFADTKLISYDRAIFRLPGKVIFLNNLVETIDSYRELKCLGPSSWIKKALKEDFFSSDFLKIEGKSIKRNRKELQTLLLFEKLKIFAFKGISLTYEELNSEASRMGCSLDVLRKSLVAREVLHLEVYLRGRFMPLVEGRKDRIRALTALKSFVTSLRKQRDYEWMIP
jgi:hypothetical protein